MFCNTAYIIRLASTVILRIRVSLLLNFRFLPIHSRFMRFKTIKLIIYLTLELLSLCGDRLRVLVAN